MGDFSSTGFAPFPDSYHDNLRVGLFSLFTDEALDSKTTEYGAFVQRQDIMPRARAAGNRVLDHLIFELAYRDGVYDEFIEPKLEDETCERA